MTPLITGRLVDGAGHAAPGWLEVRAGRIAGAGKGSPPRAPDVAHDGLVAPGLFDLQVNGAGGVEALDGGPALDAIDALLVRRGVTGWLAALPTAEDERLAGALAAIAERARDPGHGLAGAHLEGPFLSPDHPGVHRLELLREPADGVPAHFRDPCVRVVTLAPELRGALELIGSLRARGVAVALGHSDADADVARRALDAGARHVTHLFNAMAPLAHRDPGLVGVALTDARALPCLIADGHHVDPLVLRLTRLAAGDRAILVSDASAAAAAAGESHTLAGVPVRRDPSGAVRTADGRLAGSGILLDDAVHNWVRLAGADGSAALAAASSRPAQAIRAGAGLAPGVAADLVLATDDGAVQRVMRRGAWQ
jgi:N-acetylglucosamine-6-phosphate deacetylase